MRINFNAIFISIVAILLLIIIFQFPYFGRTEFNTFSASNDYGFSNIVGISLTYLAGIFFFIFGFFNKQSALVFTSNVNQDKGKISLGDLIVSILVIFFILSSSV